MKGLLAALHGGALRLCTACYPLSECCFLTSGPLNERRALLRAVDLRGPRVVPTKMPDPALARPFFPICPTPSLVPPSIHLNYPRLELHSPNSDIRSP